MPTEPIEAEIGRIEADFRAALAAAGTVRALEAVRVGFLGKKGALTGLLKRLGALPADERPRAGQLVNVLKETIQAAIDEAARTARERSSEAALDQERVDVTLPTRRRFLGSLHPV